ncbi:Flp family type IVb pilin [Nocardioides marmoribigeumensis]|uniref:Pilus assembly protein Flp/PilA n=1 Tax=Nocardioides marmoribigeumensis TaxID=433649 RepID=A0ABU2BPK4_9ACTN|nr:Flp family type IVb pilin [Nocardioides marmoribigeumensis]MDR7360552.1 pilus assembly protein Flp/PilA [Nocardioides marmoribigeumensis]
MISRARRRLVGLERDEAGASAVEYGLLAVAIAALIVIIVFALGGVVQDLFDKTCNSIQGSAQTDATC